MGTGPAHEPTWMALHDLFDERELAETEQAFRARVTMPVPWAARERRVSLLGATSIGLVRTDRAHRTDVLVALAGGDPRALGVAASRTLHHAQAVSAVREAAADMLLAARDELARTLRERGRPRTSSAPGV